MRWVKRTLRFFLVTAGIIFLTSFGIDAADMLGGNSLSALGIVADRVTEGSCPSGMTQVSKGGDDMCVDTYEVSPSSECRFQTLSHLSQTDQNLAQVDCVPVSKPDADPWTQVTYHQAKELCAKAGKRLPANSEWYEAALGTVESGCLVDEDTVSQTGSAGECRSGAGVYDMVGNVWEWVEASVEGGSYEGRILPAEGYVANADDAGVASETTEQPGGGFGNDYFWSQSEGSLAMIRGGFFGSGSDAGLYSVHADVAKNFSGSSIGFRCIK